MQMSNIIETSTPQHTLFSTLQLQHCVKSKRKAYNTIFQPVRTTDKQPQRSILMCPQHKKSVQKVLILPLMDIKHYKQILGQNQLNHKQERLRFAAQYMQQMPATHHKKYFAQSFCINKKPQLVNNNKMEHKIARSVDLKKQESISQHANNLVITSPQVFELQPHKKTKSFLHAVKPAKEMTTSPNEGSLQKGKTSGIQRMLSRYQNLQEQSDGSGYQVMSKWLIGRRLTHHKERS